MTLLIALILVLGALSLGEIASLKSKAVIPSVFITAILFLIGYWTIFPEDILEIAGFGMPIVTTSMLFLVTHMGTLFSLKELLSKWKTAMISIVGILGLCIFVLVGGGLFFPKEMLVVATPPLTGGIVAASIMSEAATSKGLETLGVLAILMYVMQGFIGYPLTSICLRKEGQRLLKLFREGRSDVSHKVKVNENSVEEKTIFPQMKKEYQTTSILLLKLAIASLLASYLEVLLGGHVSKYVLCLLVGVVGAETGLIERRPLELSGTFGFYITGLMAFVFGGLSKATPQMISSLLVPFTIIIILGALGMAVGSIVTGKIFGETWSMSYAIALNAFYGFPINLTLTTEASKALGESEEETEFLMESMLPKMIIGGFTSVTVVSVLIAGVFTKML